MKGIRGIITAHDQRGISALSRHLPDRFCEDAAALLAHGTGLVIIVTGFYIADAAAAETDGPPGAIAIGDALQRLGRRVLYVSDDPAAALMQAVIPGGTVLRFPKTDDAESAAFAVDLIKTYRPELIIATERCGRTRDGTYLNMRGQDISAHTARIDALFTDGVQSIGIGDGGNEIGMGNLVDYFPQYAATRPGLAADPCVTQTTRLIIASVADWGAYGLLAALSGLVRRNLLPSADDQCALVARLVAHGAVDGVTGQPTVTVDGHDLDMTSRILHDLDALVRTA